MTEDSLPKTLLLLSYQDINSLNKQIAQLQDFVRAKGCQSGRHLQTHSNTIVVSLQSKLASMSNDFKSVLEVRTENLKQQRNRREQFSRAPVSALPLAPNNLGKSEVLTMGSLGAKFLWLWWHPLNFRV